MFNRNLVSSSLLQKLKNSGKDTQLYQGVDFFVEEALKLTYVQQHIEKFAGATRPGPLAEKWRREFKEPIKGNGSEETPVIIPWIRLCANATVFLVRESIVRFILRNS
jgi:hypothetical protein